MLRSPPWALFAIAVAVIAPAVVRAANTPGPPFKVSWSEGACPNCRTAQSIGEVRFADGADIWGLGFSPPGETGAGDWSIVHSVDGGRTWREARDSYEHNEPPSISFASARRGWVMVADMSAAEQRLSATSDGGVRWRRLPLRNLFVRDVQYLGHDRGFGYGFDPYRRQSYLYATTDGGRRWRKTSLPAGLSVDAMSFSDGRNGLIGGCLQGRNAVSRTSDGGLHWSTRFIETPQWTAISTSGCDAEFDHLELSAGGRAWLLVQKRSFANGDTAGYAAAWGSTDGGQTWTRQFETKFNGYPGTFTDFEGPYRLGDTLTLILERGPDNRTSALYSEGLGGSWTETPLKVAISGCLATRNSLVCSGSGFGLARITLENGG